MIIAPIAALIAALMVVGAAAGGGADLGVRARDRIDEVVEDEGRREQADEVLEDVEGHLVEAAEAYGEMIERVSEMTRDREAGAPEFEAVFAEMELAERDAQFIDLRFRLKNTLTREEWQELFPPPTALAE